MILPFSGRFLYHGNIGLLPCRKGASVLDAKLIKELRGIVGRDHVTAEKQDLLCYSYDATQMEFLPDAVVFPVTADEISRILILANRERIPVFPRGAGSGFSGGSLPKGGGIVLVTTRMNSIIEIDTENLVTVVEPGVVTGDLQDAVEREGLFYPPDPASLRFSTIGGNVAECAGGPRAVKYGVTKDYVIGLEVVLPTGRIINTGGVTVKGVVGYDMTKLLCGSEGTLGVITKIIIRLLPLPERRKTMLAVFDSIDGAARAVSTIIRNRIIPVTLEFMDHSAIKCVEGRFSLGIPEAARAVLLIELDGESAQVENESRKIIDLISGLGLVQFSAAADAMEAEELWKARRLMSPALRQVNPDKINEDIVVPRARVPDIIRRIDVVREKYGLPIINFGHAGDGNIHVNIMIDRSVPGESEKAEEAVREILAATLELGGSMSGEHGVGLSKAPYLPMELSPDQIDTMKAIKKALDPNNILNPGKMFQ
jgi:glycolate oxidase